METLDTMEDQNASFHIETDFQWALRVKNRGVLERLLSESQTKYVSEKDNFGRSPFHLACMKGQDLIVRILLEHINKTDIDINEKDRHEMTGYHYACIFHQKQVKKLLETFKPEKITEVITLKEADDIHMESAFP